MKVFLFHPLFFFIFFTFRSEIIFIWICLNELQSQEITKKISIMNCNYTHNCCNQNSKWRRNDVKENERNKH